MAPGQKTYPRATVKKIVKAHSKCNVSKNVDVMIFLDYVLFMQTLVKEAAIDSKQAGERNIDAKSIRKVTPVGSILGRTNAADPISRSIPNSGKRIPLRSSEDDTNGYLVGFIKCVKQPGSSFDSAQRKTHHHYYFVATPLLRDGCSLPFE
ncbi:hypothetical protein F5B17DRAFT_254171 [Nemania serpens]|nr:hypothetical protein F5B17DRAFT_254171 [Nemania serpens]